MDKQLVDLARLVEATADNEIDCDELLRRVAAYVQALRDGAARTEYLAQVEQHLKVCPECREEFTALLTAEGLEADLP